MNQSDRIEPVAKAAIAAGLPASQEPFRYTRLLNQAWFVETSKGEDSVLLDGLSVGIHSFCSLMSEQEVEASLTWLRTGEIPDAMGQRLEVIGLLEFDGAWFISTSLLEFIETTLPFYSTTQGIEQRYPVGTSKGGDKGDWEKIVALLFPHGFNHSCSHPPA